MAKTYFNNAIVGNSSMLGCLTDRGELVRLFWPNIDYPQHIEKFSTGIFFTDRKNSTIWLEDHSWACSQQYVTDANIVETSFENRERGLKVLQQDFVLPSRDVLIRRYTLENMAEYENKLGFILYSSAVSTNPDLSGSLFDFDADALIHYRHGYYISINADRESFQFQVGSNAFESAAYTNLTGFDSIGMMKDGAVSWDLGTFSAGERKTFAMFICASDNLKGVKRLAGEMKKADIQSAYEATVDYWTTFIKKARYVEFLENGVPLKNTNIEKPLVAELYKRSLLVFKLMSDKRTGGLLAAPEIDEEFTRCGRYAYCWGRDAAFITDALDRCGLTDAVDSFYKWAVEVQDENGAWHQRYHMDGNLAPSWGLQIDETGTLIWGMLKHYETVRDKRFLEDMWESVYRGVEFLTGFIDSDTGLPAPSFDLWEERFGEHAYSAAAVYGGITAGVKIARILNAPGEVASRWEKAASGIKAAIERSLWKEDWGRFIRSVRTKLNPWGEEHTWDKVVIKVNPKGYMRDLTCVDGTVDISLLGLAVPFNVFDASDTRIKGTVDVVEKVLTSPGVGGIKRYENDGYIGGNPWIIATLWAALYHIEVENYPRALEYLEWTIRSRTGLSLLPEQVDRDSGRPAWVIPLTWSHAMFVLVLTGLLDAGIL